MCSAMEVFILIILLLVARKLANANVLTSSSVTATVGVDFTFTCETSANILKFSRNGIAECVITGQNPNGSCKFSIGWNTNFRYDCNIRTKVYKLTIPKSFNIDTLHDSTWTCGPALDPGESDPIRLYVNVPITNVTISRLPTDTDQTDIILGANKTFICKTNAGRPSSLIKWYIAGKEIRDQVTQPNECTGDDCKNKVVSSSELIYTGMKVDNGKNIYCTAENVIGYGIQSVDQRIVIIYGPSNVTFSPSQQIYTVVEPTGTLGPVSCEAHDCKPTCTSKWSGPNRTSYNSSLLHLQNITRNQKGNYFCNASNVAWSMTSVNIIVTVNYGPNQVNIFPITQNYNVTEIDGSVGPINCTANCKPECSMQWNGPFIPDGTTSILHLQNIKRTNDGIYKCIATNDIGSQISAIVTIIVNYGPGLVNIAPNTSLYTVTENNGKVGPIRCTADCKPNCTMTWNGPNIPASTMSILTLLNLDRNQTGNYTCTATNSYGSQTSTTLQVIVNYGPREVKLLPSNRTYITTELTGNVGPITCEADCKPKCRMTWNGPNLTEGISAVLHLRNISKTQAGEYSCVASNFVDNKTSIKVMIIVNYGPDVVNISPAIQHYTVNETDSFNSSTCTANCKPSCKIIWIGPNLPSELTPVLNIHKITRNQTGTYKCKASNSVGSQISSSVNITVNFRPDVTDILGNRSFYENDTVAFSCNVESEPTANIVWFFYDKTIGSDMVMVNNKMTPHTNYQIRNLIINRISCLSMGTYRCAANNIIGEDSKKIDIDVICSPRTNSIEFNVTTLIAVKDQEPLNITAPIVAFPKPYIYWMFFNNETLVNVTHKSSNIFLKNRVFSNLYIENVTETDFGNYRMHAVNGIGSTSDYIYSVEVIPERKPNPPDNVTCTGRPNSVLVIWKSNFDGGDTQSFQIFIKKDGSANFHDYGQNYGDPGPNHYLNAAIENLTPDKTYHVRVQASNKHNISISEIATCNTTSSVLNDQQKTNTLAIGAGTGIGGAFVVLVIVAVVFIFVRRRKVDEKIGQDKELMQRSVDSEEENDDGLRENPLYVSSTHEVAGAVYSVVDKKRHLDKNKDNLKDENTIYTQVDKTPQKDKKNKEIEMGFVYQNSEDINKHQNDEVYANSGVIDSIKDNQVNTPPKNKDGLIYADLDLAPMTSGNRFVIRGLENRNNYAVIDLTKTAEPLPSDSDSDCDNKKE